MKPHRQLKVGDRVPAFWTRDIHGHEVDTKKLKGHTLLAFLRYAGCPFCNLAIYRLSHEYKLLDKSGCNVVAFVQSTEDNIEKNIISRQDVTPPFPIIADLEQDFYRLFGIQPSVTKTVKHSIKHASHWVDSAFKKGFMQSNVDGSGFMVPAMFLVDERGIIKLVDYEANFYDDSTFTPIYELLTFDTLS